MKHSAHALWSFLFACTLLLMGLGTTRAADDWPYWRGPEFNGISRATGILDDFDPNDVEATDDENLWVGEEGSNVAWKRSDLAGRSTPVTMNGHVYVLCRVDPEKATEGERVVCLDAKTGKTVWEKRFNVWLSDVPDTRVGWSSVSCDPETGYVYALGVCGLFQCLDGKSGDLIWSMPLHEKFGLLSTYGGRTNFPIIHEDLVIISAIVIGWGEMAKPAHRFLGVNKKTGEVVWFKSTRLLPYDTTYSAPILTVVNGQKMLIFGSGDGAVWALQPRTGEPIWQFPFSRRGLNVAPILVDDTVYIGHSEENTLGNTMGSVAAIDATGSGKVKASWRVDELMAGKSSPLYLEGRIYVVDDRGKLYVLDAKTGEQIARKALGSVARTSPLFVDGKIFTIANDRWYVLEPTDRGVDFVNKGRLPRGEECNSSPICSYGCIFVTTTGGLYCLHDASKQAGVEPAPEPTPEAAVASDEKPAYLQLVPAESLVKPGEELKFTARLFNSRGQFLKETEADFELAGAGQIEDGTFVASSDAAHTATVVTAKAAGLTGTARVRIVPPLPWSFDFEALDDLPVTWVGARYRHQLREVDGSKVAVKVTTIPKGTRSRCWFGHPELSNYTIQADVKGAITNNKMPDMGIIAQGYCLNLQGENQRLEIRSWVTQDNRSNTKLEHPWKPNTWYTLKLQASTSDGKAVLKGKVWPRGEQEPADWMIELLDESPNASGSPGLFGSAKDAEIYLDNIKVTANDDAS